MTAPSPAARKLAAYLRTTTERTAGGHPVLALRNGRRLTIVHGCMGWTVQLGGKDIAQPRTFNALVEVVLAEGAK